MSIHPAITIYDTLAHQFLHTDIDIQLLDGGFRFTEGPVWNKEGFYLFSDIPQNVIYRLEEGKGKTIFLEQSGCTPGNTRALAEQIGSNGLAYDSTGNLLVCQHGNGAVASYDGSFLKPHINTFNGKPFNSPNDIVVHKNGSIFFSDPPYGLKDQQLDAEKYQSAAGVYCYRDGATTLVTDRYQYPNGVCLSPDQRSLFTCSNKPFEAFVLEWDAETLQLKRKVAAENGDGIKCDRFGNLWLCSKEGIVIINNDGKRLARIALETVPANCCWGGKQGNDLLVTARQNIFLISGLQKA